MSQWRQKAIQGIRENDEFVFTRSFSRKDVEIFGDITRDYNPVHYDERFSAAKGFQGMICHGLLIGGLVCELGGQIAWLASSMNFWFKAPVYAGDTVTCRVRIIKIKTNGRASAEFTLENQNGILVCEGNLEGFLPNEKDRGILTSMIEEGDHANKIRCER